MNDDQLSENEKANKHLDIVTTDGARIDIKSQVNTFATQFHKKCSNTNIHIDTLIQDYETFKDHKVGNWYAKLLEVDGCISIKNITEFDDYFQIQEAVKITPMQLNKEDFKVDVDKMIVADYSALDKMVDVHPPSNEALECYKEKVVQGKSKKRTEKDSETCYVSFIINDKGELLFPKPYDNTNRELSMIAIDIIQKCGLRFIPGEIGGKKVSSMVYFPIKF